MGSFAGVERRTARWAIPRRHCTGGGPISGTTALLSPRHFPGRAIPHGCTWGSAKIRAKTDIDNNWFLTGF
jgi:hypothetical protein